MVQDPGSEEATFYQNFKKAKFRNTEWVTEPQKTPARQKKQRYEENKSHDSPLFGTAKRQNLCILNLNCHSIVNKRAEFTALVDYIKPYVILGTESWLKTNIGTSEVFPEEYIPYREDRATLARGIFILVHRSLTSSELVKWSGQKSVCNREKTY